MTNAWFNEVKTIFENNELLKSNQRLTFQFWSILKEQIST
jgi:hypothetical protein